MMRKPVDLMVGNRVSNGLIGSSEVTGFQKDRGEYYFVTKENISQASFMTKKEVGEHLVKWFEELN
jgi:hypothetical protein